jgi:hypothetical protein
VTGNHADIEDSMNIKPEDVIAYVRHLIDQGETNLQLIDEVLAKPWKWADEIKLLIPQTGAWDEQDGISHYRYRGRGLGCERVTDMGVSDEVQSNRKDSAQAVHQMETSKTTEELEMKVETNVNKNSAVWLIIDNENWIEVEFVDGEFKIETYRDTQITVKQVED